MTINFSVEIENDILKIKSKGVCNNLNQLKEYVSGIHKAAMSNGLTKVLVDETELVFQLSTTETFDSGRFLSEVVPQGSRLAVVCSLKGWKETKFWETVALNRGVKVKIFSEINEAEKWISG